jgi:hypothetical protein
MLLYECLDVSWLNLQGIALGFVGTTCMVYGGIDTIFKIVKVDDGQYFSYFPIMADKEISDYEEAHRKNIQEWNYIRNHILINKLCIWLLFSSLAIQFLTLLLDS